MLLVPLSRITLLGVVSFCSLWFASLVIGSSTPAPMIAFYASNQQDLPVIRVMDLRTHTSYDLSVAMATPFPLAWSPDGRYLYYSDRTTDERVLDIHAFDTHTRRSTRLTTDRSIDLYPIPSPDGRWLSYMQRSSTISTLHLLNLQTNTRRTLQGSYRSLGLVSWAADSESFVFIGEGDAIFRYDIATDTVQTITNRGGQVRDPIWITGRDQIYYRALNAGQYTLQGVATVGGIARHITELYTPLGFSPTFDGRYIALNDKLPSTTRPSGADVLLLDTHTGNIRNLTQTPDNDEWIWEWLPNEEDLLISQRIYSGFDTHHILERLNVKTGQRTPLVTATSDQFDIWWGQDESAQS